MQCPRCGGLAIKNGSTRGVCKSGCGSFPKSGVFKRIPQERLPAEECPRCFQIQRPHRHSQGRVTCTSCGEYYTRRAVAATKTPDRRSVKSRIVITCAVSDSPLHAPALASLLTYVKAHDAELVVVPLRYQNPTSQAGALRRVAYPPDLTEHLYSGRMAIGKNLLLLGDVKVQPTAVCPLSGLDGISGTSSCILPHPRLALASVPTRAHELPKLMLTTGAITRPVYSRSKAGAKGAFAHSLGAVVVELDGDLFHVRHLQITPSGSFIDLDTEYDGEDVRPALPAHALVLGDIHAEMADPEAVAAGRQIQALLKPKRLVLHDVHNHGSASHHSNFWERFARRVTRRDSVSDELKTTAAMIDSWYREGQETVVVSSNHNDHLARWLEDYRNGQDVENAAFYHGAKAKVLAWIAKNKGKVPDIFSFLAGELLQKPARLLSDRDSYAVAKVELAYHGDRGPNGARGSAKSLDRIGTKSIIGHSHSPAISGGCFQVGTMSMLDMGYNTGPSSWLHGAVVIYSNGKRSHIHIIKGRFHG